MVEYNLTKANRLTLSRVFRGVKRIDIAIDCVIENQMGQAYVDEKTNPNAFKLQIGPFCYFAGDFESKKAKDMIRYIEPYSLIMVCPEEAIISAREIHGERLVRFPRYSFSSENLSIKHVDALLENSPFRSRISKIDEILLKNIADQPNNFLDISSYDSAEDFMARGIGYAITDSSKLIAVAYASLVNNTSIEVSIYVEPEYRRKGIATILGGALLKDCLERNIDPHWDAANIESCTLAEKLGYIQIDTYYAHYLKQN